MLPGEKLRLLLKGVESEAIGLVLAIRDWEVVVVDILSTYADAIVRGRGLIIHFLKRCTTFFTRCSTWKHEAGKGPAAYLEGESGRVTAQYALPLRR